MTPQAIVKQAIEQKDSSKIVVIYHGNCSDGFGAAWSVYKALGEAAEYFPATHGKFDPLVLKGDYCFVVDFSFELEILLGMQRHFKHVVVLDHHASAKDDLAEFGCSVFDNDRSGAGITWDTFHPNEPRPKLIGYIEDRDLWRKHLKFSDEIACITEMQRFDFHDWTRYSLDLEMDNSFQGIVNQGYAVLEYKKHTVRSIADRARKVQFAGFEVPVVNCDHTFASDVGNVLAHNNPFAIIWRQAQDGKFLYSLRSTEAGEDVSKIASKFGGGGHRCASGFASDTLLT